MKTHDHTCHCGTADVTPHKINTRGCVRVMTKTPRMVSDHAELGCAMWDVGDADGKPITDFTLRQQRGYHQHPCGCWSRVEGSTNSIEA